MAAVCGPLALSPAAAAAPTATPSAPTRAKKLAPPSRLQPPGAVEPAVVIDLRPFGTARGRRAALWSALARTKAAVPVTDPVLRAALAGRRYSPPAAAARAALARAAAARGRGDCAAASSAAYEAIFHLAAAQAAGVDPARASDQLVRAYSVVLLCADARGDSATAARAASRIRTISAGARPPSVPAAVWAHYPAIDATIGLKWMKLVVDTDPPGAAVWVDHARVGTAPVTTYVAEGRHIVGAGKGGASASRRIQVTGATSIALSLDPAPARYSGVRRRVAALRRRGGVTPAEIDVLLSRADARVALVLSRSPAAGATLWASEDVASPARRLGRVPDGPTAAAVVGERIRAWRIREAIARRAAVPRPSALNLGHHAATGQKNARAGGTPWWAYVAIAGAVALGAGVAAAAKLSHDTQTIELSWP